MLLQVPQVAGLALGFAALNVHFKDIKDILNNLITFLFFLTPILYSLKTLEGTRRSTGWSRSTPSRPFARAYQEAVFYGRVPSPGLWLAMLASSAIVWWLGATLFDRLSETLVEAV